MKQYKHPRAAAMIAVDAMVVPYTGLPGEYDMVFHQGLFAVNGAAAGMMGRTGGFRK